jgi:hypothetical protein
MQIKAGHSALFFFSFISDCLLPEVLRFSNFLNILNLTFKKDELNQFVDLSGLYRLK